jgi:hypothetical protein
MRRKLASAVFAALLASAAHADPYAVYFYPCGIQAGTTRRIVVGGQGLRGVKGGWITGKGVTVTRVTPVPGFPRARGKGQAKWMQEWIFEVLDGVRKKHELPEEATIADSDWHPHNWWYNMHKCDVLELSIMARDLFVPKDDLQSSPSLAHLVILDVKADADAEPGRRDIMVYDSKGVSAPYSFFVSKTPRQEEPPYMLRCPYMLKKRGEPSLDPVEPPVAFDGQIFPGEVDVFFLKLKKGQNLVCAVTARELLPFLGDAVPGFFNAMVHLYDPDGEQVAYADDFFYLPDPVLRYKVPKDGVYRFEIHDNLYRGRSDFVYTVDCTIHDDDRLPFTPQERALRCFSPPTTHRVPRKGGKTIVMPGVLDCPGRTVRHYFDVPGPYTGYRMEVFARRQGSPLDATLKLYGPVGNLPLNAAAHLATWDQSPEKLFDVRNLGSKELPIIKTNMLFTGSVLQFERDPVGEYVFEQPGRYCLTVEDISRAGGDEYVYTLAIGPKEPTFEVYGTKSSFLMKDGDFGADMEFRVLKLNGFKGEVVLDDTPEYTITTSVLNERMLRCRITMEKDEWRGVKCLQLTASAEMPDGTRKTVRVTPTDPAEQAFAYTHLVPQPGFFFCAPLEKEPEVVKDLNTRKEGFDYASWQTGGALRQDDRR